MSTLRDHYKAESDKYYNLYQQMSGSLAYLSGSIVGILKYGSLSRIERITLAKGLLTALTKAETTLSTSDMNYLKEISEEKSLAY